MILHSAVDCKVPGGRPVGAEAASWLLALVELGHQHSRSPVPFTQACRMSSPRMSESLPLAAGNVITEVPARFNGARRLLPGDTTPPCNDDLLRPDGDTDLRCELSLWLLARVTLDRRVWHRHDRAGRELH